MSSDEVIVQRAQSRAMLTSFLSGNDGEHAVADIAEAVGLSRISAGQLLKHMAEDGLVRMRQEGLKKFYSLTSGEPDELVTLPEDQDTKRQRRRGTKDVELVVSGTMIVIGRNPTSGRLRITLEDVE